MPNAKKAVPFQPVPTRSPRSLIGMEAPPPIPIHLSPLAAKAGVVANRATAASSIRDFFIRYDLLVCERGGFIPLQLDRKDAAAVRRFRLGSVWDTLWVLLRA